MATKDGRRARDKTAYGTLSEERLRALLEHDCENDCIVAARYNKISRKHYARLLWCTASAMTQFRTVFAEYELKHGVVTGAKRHFPEMCEWVNTAYEARELELRGGKLDRSAFREHFE